MSETLQARPQTRDGPLLAVRSPMAGHTAIAVWTAVHHRSQPVDNPTISQLLIELKSIANCSLSGQ